MFPPTTDVKTAVPPGAGAVWVIVRVNVSTRVTEFAGAAEVRVGVRGRIDGRGSDGIEPDLGAHLIEDVRVGGAEHPRRRVGHRDGIGRSDRSDDEYGCEGCETISFQHGCFPRVFEQRT